MKLPPLELPRPPTPKVPPRDIPPPAPGRGRETRLERSAKFESIGEGRRAGFLLGGVLNVSGSDGVLVVPGPGSPELEVRGAFECRPDPPQATTAAASVSGAKLRNMFDLQTERARNTLVQGHLMQSACQLPRWHRSCIARTWR
jgi:hypothetical protein